ncbi:MAG: hypothetical protein LBI13_08415 [Streptococcaceae bacterium]|jgi:hypothetical protein|nr:hypothetical protein [Streptococcaceae bacterium]
MDNMELFLYERAKEKLPELLQPAIANDAFQSERILGRTLEDIQRQLTDSNTKYSDDMQEAGSGKTMDALVKNFENLSQILIGS